MSLRTAPAGTDVLVRQLTQLELPADRPVLVHCSLRAVDPAAPRPVTMLNALRAALGPGATLVVSAQTPGNSFTSRAYVQATTGMSAQQEQAYRRHMPGFDPATTPSLGVGALAECVRQAPGAVRSQHPQSSFVALGADAHPLMRHHDLDCHLGERSPLGALYAARASILLIGVGYEVCTAFHLAEYRQKRPGRLREYHCFVRRNGRRTLHQFVAPHLDDTDFDRIGADIESSLFVNHGRVGGAAARALSLQAAVDAAVVWMDKHRRL